MYQPDFQWSAGSWTSILHAGHCTWYLYDRSTWYFRKPWKDAALFSEKETDPQRIRTLSSTSPPNEMNEKKNLSDQTDSFFRLVNYKLV